MQRDCSPFSQLLLYSADVWKDAFLVTLILIQAEAPDNDGESKT